MNKDMRWLSFYRDERLSFGYVVDDGVVDVGLRSRYRSLRQALQDDALAFLQALCGQAPDLSLEGLEFAPTIPDAQKILCVGLNYRSHLEEMGHGREAYPTVFTRFASAQVGHLQTLTIPQESDKLDYEGEIALIIGKGGRRIKHEDALKHVAGYSIFNDGSVRDFQRQTSQFTAGKNFVGSGAFGPWMLSASDIVDPNALRISTRVNGETRQEASSDMLLFGFEDLIAYCSTFTELEAGDVIVTGTPGGVGAAMQPAQFLKDGDLVEVELSGVGILQNSVIKEVVEK